MLIRVNLCHESLTIELKKSLMLVIFPQSLLQFRILLTMCFGCFCDYLQCHEVDQFSEQERLPYDLTSNNFPNILHSSKLFSDTSIAILFQLLTCSSNF